LAKNQAYTQLATEASGEFLLFCGVDVRFGPQSIRQLVTLLSAKHKRMLSLTPVNESPGLSFSQAIRYYWELTLPRRLFNRPPVMSSCWLIESKLLTQSGGFAAIRLLQKLILLARLSNTTPILLYVVLCTLASCR
jgi:hypothetical protein